MDMIFTKKKTSILGLVGFVQFIMAGVYTATISRDNSSFVLGYSKERLALLTLISLLAIACLACSYFSFFRWNKTKNFIANNEKKIVKVYITLFIGTFIFFFIVFNSPTIFGKNFDAYYERLFPLAISTFLFMVETSVLYLLNKKKQIGPQWGNDFNMRQDKPVLIISIVLFLTLLGSYLTKFGLLLKTRYWNVPGVPVSMQQLLVVFFFFVFLNYLYKQIPQIGKLLSNRKAIIILAFVVYLVTVLIWGNTPLERHFFSLVPAAPNFQPYPHSDARLHDLGALSILMGKGIFFHNYTDKPLLMVIFAVCHLFAGNDYVLLQNVLVAFLAFIPVAVFLLGRKFHNAVFGLFASFVVILQQKNAIQLSTIVPSVNVKLEVTETFTLLGVVLLVLALFLWAKTKSEKYIFIAGAIVACLSLIRMNPLIYMPAIGLLLLVVFWKSWKKFSKQLLILCAGFLLVFTPWLVTGTNAEGIPWSVIKIQDVIKNRVTPTLEEHLSTFESESDLQSDSYVSEVNPPRFLQGIEQFDLPEVDRTSILPLDQLVFMTGLSEEIGLETTYLYLFANHLIHNVDTLFLSLPDSLITQDVYSIAQREYLHDGNIWNGHFPGKQILLILVNFSLFSAGLFYSWKKHSWSGLIPAFCLFTYVLAISIALTSGGRYIVPINWILYFYYLFGFVFVLDWLSLLIKTPGMGSLQDKQELIDMGKRSWRSILVVVVIISLLIPVSNMILPLVISAPTIQQQDVPFDNQYQEGIVFYPYYKDDQISFDIVQGQNIRNFKVMQRDIAEPGFILQNEEIVLFSENENNEITELIIIRDRIIVKYIKTHAEVN